MSEHNINLHIKDVFSSKDGKISRIHVIGNNENNYIVYIDEKTRSVVSAGDGKMDHKEILKFIDDFMKEVSTETNTNV